MLWVERKRKLNNDNLKKASSLTIESLTLKKPSILDVCNAWPCGQAKPLDDNHHRRLFSWPAACGGRQIQFLLGFITLSAASGYKIMTDGPFLLSGLELGPLISGILIAFVTSLIAVKWFVAYIGRHGMALFAWYRIILVCHSPLL